MRKHAKKVSLLATLVLGICLGIGGYLLFNIYYSPVTSASNPYHRIDEVQTILDTLYFDKDKLNTRVMIENAVKAYVDAIDDPYTVYMDSKTNSGFQEELKGESDFEGIGAVISKKDYYILIEEVIKDSPAFKAGLQPLDRIVMINTGATKTLTINDAVSQIRGKKGTIVRLTIERVKKDNSKELFEKDVTRDKLSLPSVTSKILTGANNKTIGLVTISIIGEETENLLKLEILNLKANNVQGIILDLRGNGGGFLPIAVEIASHFIPKDKLVVTARYKQLGEEEYASKWYGQLEGIPTVVLMDGMTASAGEIIAMALQEQIGAKLIGTQTFGKGSIQSMEDFKDGASIKYTIGKRYAPSDKNIDKIWVTPDVAIPFDAEAYKLGKDTQLEKAKEIVESM